MWPLLATVLSELLNCIIPNVDLLTPCAHPMSQCNDQDKLFFSVCKLIHVLLHSRHLPHLCGILSTAMQF